MGAPAVSVRVISVSGNGILGITSPEQVGRNLSAVYFVLQSALDTVPRPNTPGGVAHQSAEAVLHRHVATPGMFTPH